jgi:FtsH-binding integral membrane protein
VPAATQQFQSQSKQRQTTDLQNLDSRVGFVRKVYGLLSLQLMLTFGIVVFFQGHKAALLPFFMGPSGNAVMLLSLAVSIFTMLVFEFRPSLQTKSPANFGLLGLFTLAQAVPVAVITLLFTTSRHVGVCACACYLYAGCFSI